MSTPVEHDRSDDMWHCWAQTWNWQLLFLLRGISFLAPSCHAVMISELPFLSSLLRTMTTEWLIGWRKGCSLLSREDNGVLSSSEAQNRRPCRGVRNIQVALEWQAILKVQPDKGWIKEALSAKWRQCCRQLGVLLYCCVSSRAIWYSVCLRQIFCQRKGR